MGYIGNSVTTLDFLDLLYESVLRPELWGAMLDRLADTLGGHSATMSHPDLQAAGACRMATHPGRSLWQASAAAGYTPGVRDPLAQQARVFVGFGPQQDPHEALAGGGVIAGAGPHPMLTIHLAADDGVAGGIDIIRDPAQGPFSTRNIQDAQMLQPHLTRAFRLTRRMAEGSGDRGAGKDLSQAVFVVDAQGVIRHANAAAEQLTQDHALLKVVDGRLTAACPKAAGELRVLISDAGAREPSRRHGGGLMLEGSPSPITLSLLAAPLAPDRAPGVAADRCVLVCVSEAKNAKAPVDTLLMRRFGLTPAEARVASALFKGLSLRETAAALRLSYHTVRVQLSRVFDKMAVRRQTELVRIISTLSSTC